MQLGIQLCLSLSQQGVIIDGIVYQNHLVEHGNRTLQIVVEPLQPHMNIDL